MVSDNDTLAKSILTIIVTLMIHDYKTSSIMSENEGPPHT